MRGFVAWLSSKFAFLIFAVAIFSAFFAFFVMQSNFSVIDSQAQDAESLARITDSVCASPFPITTVWAVKAADKLVVSSNNSYWFIELDRGSHQVRKAIHCAAENAALVNVTGIRISKDNKVVLSKWE